MDHRGVGYPPLRSGFRPGIRCGVGAALRAELPGPRAYATCSAATPPQGSPGRQGIRALKIWTSRIRSLRSGEPRLLDDAGPAGDLAIDVRAHLRGRRRVDRDHAEQRDLPL